MQTSNNPTCVVEAVEPILLDAKIVEPNYCCGCGCDISSIPNAVCRCFGGEDIVLNNDGNRLFVTLGQFSILRLERDIQLLMPAYDICMPERDCNCTSGDDAAVDPCEVFERFEFPIDDFFPPRREPSCSSNSGCGNNNSCGNNSGCGNSGNNNGCGNTGGAGSRCKFK